MHHFCVILDHFWVDPGSLWGHFGIILASFWCRFRIVLSNDDADDMGVATEWVGWMGWIRRPTRKRNHPRGKG